jgi:hypothetical protein
MDIYRKAGIVTGVLFLAADAAGFLSCIARPILGADNLLAAVAGSQVTVLVTALLVFVMAWADAGIGIAMYPVLRRQSEGMALGAAGFRVLDGAFHGIAAVFLLVLVSVSRMAGAEGAAAEPAVLAQLKVLGSLALAGHDAAGSVAGLMAWCIGATLYYALFFRARLVPRWLSVWGLAGVVPTMAAILLLLFRVLEIGAPLHTVLNLPLAAQEIVLAVWLIARGFARPAGSVAQGTAT